MKDYRLNPGLRKSCKQVLHCYSLDDQGHLSFQDIPKFCGDLIAGKNRIDSEGGGDFFEGKVIECLKEKVIQKDTQLSSSCHKEVVGLMEEAAPLVAADPILEEMCPKSIERCKLETNGKGDLEIHECLKRLFGKEQLEDGRACSRLKNMFKRLWTKQGNKIIKLFQALGADNRRGRCGYQRGPGPTRRLQSRPSKVLQGHPTRCWLTRSLSR